MDGWREGGIAGGKNEGSGGKRKGRMEKGRDGYVGACMTHIIINLWYIVMRASKTDEICCQVRVLKEDS